jgi:hypothetical protein
MKKLSVYHFLALGIAIVAILIGYVAYMKFETSRKEEFKKVLNPIKAKQEAQSLVDIVGKIYVLPNETPTVATVTNKSVLPDAPFFKNAIEGDKILVFSNNHKVILYRPTLNKVVDVGELAAIEPKAKIEIADTSTSSAVTTPGNGEFKSVPKILYQSPSQ